MLFPTSEWIVAKPDSEGVDAAHLVTALDFLAANTGKDGTAKTMVVRRGRMIHGGPQADLVHGVWSMTKVFTSTVLGLLVDDGRCTLKTRAADIVGELAKSYPGITLRHLATMTSGYRASGDEPAGTYLHGPSKTPWVPDASPLFTPPGSQFAYWDSAMNLFGLVLTRLAGEPLRDLFGRRIAEPIGMDPSAWDWGTLGEDRGVAVQCGSGNMDRHVRTSPRQMARFGHLLLNDGQWNGRTLISRQWVREATRVQVAADLPWAQPECGIDGRGVYGFNWWTNGVLADGLRYWPEAPAGTFAACGFNNNRCFVIPEWQMVIVRMGLDGNVDRGVWNGFFARLAPGVH